jgi:DNA helicase-2/ATP-dependent DNA helicase PcrA
MKSRFFDELPEENLKWLTPKQQAMGAGAAARPWGSAYGAGAGKGYAPNSVANYPYSTPPSGTFDAQVSRKEAPGHGLRVNQKVFHAKFGEGTVLTLEGVGDDARAQINFPRHGTKWLALSVAKLTPLP